jgi:hypothetical protein
VYKKISYSSICFAINGRQGTELLKRSVSSSQSCGEKFADLRLTDWNTKEICGFAMCRLSKKNYGFVICGLKKYADLRFADKKS